MIRSSVPSVENPAASARIAQSRTSPPSVPGTVFGSPIPIFTSRRLLLVVRDVAVVGLDWQALFYPALDPAAHVVGVPARCAERLHRHRRAHTHPALEHDRPVG